VFQMRRSPVFRGTNRIGKPVDSTNIADYNTVFRQDASGISYSGGTIGPWQVIGATATANQATALFTDTTTPVFDILGHELSQLGQGLLTAPGGISLDQNGHPLQSFPVLTGLDPNGASSPFPLGNPVDDTSFGESGTPLDTTGLGGIGVEGSSSSNNLNVLYGYGLLTVGPTTTPTPEPSAFTLAFVGVVGLVVGRGARRCRRASASRSTGCQPAHS
jgi:hypothetical protein